MKVESSFIDQPSSDNVSTHADVEQDADAFDVMLRPDDSSFATSSGGVEVGRVLLAKKDPPDGTGNPWPGGRHGDVKAYSLRGARESNHVPPNQSYAGTPYEQIFPNADSRPAHLMDINDHRGSRGSENVGYAPSTGSSGISQQHHRHVKGLMQAGNYADAFIVDMRATRGAALQNDPDNAVKYNQGLVQAAHHALSQGAVTNEGYSRMLTAIFHGPNGQFDQDTYNWAADNGYLVPMGIQGAADVPNLNPPGGPDDDPDAGAGAVAAQASKEEQLAEELIVEGSGDPNGVSLNGETLASALGVSRDQAQNLVTYYSPVGAGDYVDKDGIARMLDDGVVVEHPLFDHYQVRYDAIPSDTLADAIIKIGVASPGDVADDGYANRGEFSNALNRTHFDGNHDIWRENPYGRGDTSQLVTIDYENVDVSDTVSSGEIMTMLNDGVLEINPVTGRLDIDKYKENVLFSLPHDEL